jgi:hypothetical protein
MVTRTKHVADNGCNDLAILRRRHFTLIEWQRDTPLRMINDVIIHKIVKAEVHPICVAERSFPLLSFGRSGSGA